MSNEYIVKLLGEIIEDIECVVLNACDTINLAKELHKRINYVIGMNRAIKDQSAIAFSEGFYDGIGADLPFEKSFKMGKLAILAMVERQDTQGRKFILADDQKKIIDQQGNEVQDIEYHIPVLFKNTIVETSKAAGYLSNLQEILLEGYEDDLKEEIEESYQIVLGELRANNRIIESLKGMSESILEEMIWQFYEQKPVDLGENLQQISCLQLFMAFFVVILQQKKQRKSYRQTLKKWLKKDAKDLSKVLIAVVEQRFSQANQSSRVLDEPLQVLLLVVTEIQQEFKLDAWLIKDIKKYQSMTDQDEASILCQKLTDKEMLNLGKPLNLEILKDFILKYKFHSFKQIKIFLPYQVIANIEKETKTIDLLETPTAISRLSPVPLGRDYEIVLGISERLSDNEQHKRWLEKYKMLIPIQEKSIRQYIISESELQQKMEAGELSRRTPFVLCKKLEDFNIDTLYKYHNSVAVIGSRLTHLCLCSDHLETILPIIYYTGVPLMLWIRSHAEETLHSSADFENICDCQFKDLPRIIKAQRESAYGITSHLGHHLSLILDDANLLPPPYRLRMA